MAQIRARYDGPHEEVLVIHPETNKLLDRVERGKWLSADVPASIRDELIARDNWTAVDYNPPGSRQGDKDGDA
jgi:hypothetical protein